MPSFSEVSRLDEKKRVTLHMTNPSGLKFSIDVELFLNRVTGEPIPEEVVQKYVRETGEEDDETDESEFTTIRNALGFCEFVASWDMTGPMKDRWTGEEIVAADEVIPLEPRIVRRLPAWLTNGINAKMVELVNPNRNGSRPSRRRS